MAGGVEIIIEDVPCMEFRHGEDRKPMTAHLVEDDAGSTKFKCDYLRFDGTCRFASIMNLGTRFCPYWIG